MSTATHIEPVQAPREIWLKLQELLGGGYEAWVKGLPDTMRSPNAVYAYLRKRQDQVFSVCVNNDWDAIVSVNLPGLGPQVIVVEKLVRRVDNRLRSLTPGELALLEIISPHLDG